MHAGLATLHDAQACRHAGFQHAAGGHFLAGDEFGQHAEDFIEHAAHALAQSRGGIGGDAGQGGLEIGAGPQAGNELVQVAQLVVKLAELLVGRQCGLGAGVERLEILGRLLLPGGLRVPQRLVGGVMQHLMDKGNADVQLSPAHRAGVQGQLAAPVVEGLVKSGPVQAGIGLDLEKEVVQRSRRQLLRHAPRGGRVAFIGGQLRQRRLNLLPAPGARALRRRQSEGAEDGLVGFLIRGEFGGGFETGRLGDGETGRRATCGTGGFRVDWKNVFLRVKNYNLICLITASFIAIPSI